MLIIFDLDDTIIDTTNTLTPFSLEKTLVELEKRGLFISDFSHTLQKLLALDRKCESAAQTFKFFLSNERNQKYFNFLALELMYKKTYIPKKISLTPYALETLHTLSEKHYLALVTVGDSKIQLAKLEKAGVDRALFCKIAVLESKQKKMCYKSIIKKFNTNKQNVIVCGDKIKVDLFPAKQLGCHTVHMQWGRGKNQPDTYADSVDYTITQLSEIIGIIEGL